LTESEVEIVNKLGLHARAAAKLTALATEFTSDVWMSKNGKRVNAKSIMGVMMLAAARGSKVTIEADGADENEAIRALSELIASRFGEAE
jgi:phosphocarrier protein